MRANADFRALWMAQGVSALGSRVTRTALPAIAVLSVGGSPLELGILSAVTVGPGALVALLAGGRIDRGRKRPVLVAADLVRAALVLTLPLAAWWGALTMMQLYVVAALVGMATAVFAITDNAYLVHLVEDDELVAANARLETTESIAEIVGPGLAGVLIEAITAPFAMVVDAASYVLSAAFLRRIRVDEPSDTSTAPRSLRRDLEEGLRAVWNEPRVRPHLIVTALQTLADGFFFALYMIYTLDVLGISIGAIGLVISVGGIGALFGATLSKWFAGRTRLFLAFAFAQAAAILIPLAEDAVFAGLALLVLHQLLSDGFEVAYQVHAISHRQRYLARGVLARANGIFTATETILLPLAALGAGAFAEVVGIRTALFVAVAFGLVASLPLLGLPRDLD